MGIRPSFHTVFGLGNQTLTLEQNRILWGDTNFELTYPDDSDFLFRSMMTHPKEKRILTMEELLWYGNEFGNEDLIGLHLFEDVWGDIAYMIYGTLLDYTSWDSGRKEFPLETTEAIKKMTDYEKRTGRNMNTLKSQFYALGYSAYVPTWRKVTKYLLDQLGVKSNPDDYRLYLVWQLD